MKDKRTKQVEFAAWVGIVGNILLAIVKWIVGTMANSKALVADSVHSATDVIGSLAVLIGVRASNRPPDKDHPYGHGKAESIAAIIVAVILFVVGLEIGYGSIKSIFEPIEAPGMLAIFVALGSMLFKEWMFRYKFRLGKKLNSQALIANAWEHRSDVYSSFAALIGIGGAVIGGYLHIEWLIYLDPIAGLFVSLLVLKMAYNIISESIHATLDHVMHDEDTVDMVNLVKGIDSVLNINQFRAREHGHYVVVDVKIAVDPHITVLEGHRISKEVKNQLIDHFPIIKDVFVHVNPHDPSFQYRKMWDGEQTDKT